MIGSEEGERDSCGQYAAAHDVNMPVPVAKWCSMIMQAERNEGWGFTATTAYPTRLLSRERFYCKMPASASSQLIEGGTAFSCCCCCRCCQLRSLALRCGAHVVVVQSTICDGTATVEVLSSGGANERACLFSACLQRSVASASFDTLHNTSRMVLV